MSSPLELEREELGHSLEEVRDHSLRVVKRSHPSSDCCLFLVHGGGGRAGQFKHQIKELQEEMNVVAIDFLGHGDSPKPNNPQLYTSDVHLEDLKEIYERHKKSRNVFMSHCYGCVHTLRLIKWLRGQGREAEVKGVIMIALGVITPVSVGLVIKLPAFILEILRPLARASSNASTFTSTSDPSLIEFENSISNGNRMYMMKVIGRELSSQSQWDIWLQEGKEALGADIPRALLCGEEDGLFSVESCQEAGELLGVEKNLFQIVPAVGHLPMLESPQEVNRICKEFISTHVVS